MKAIKQSYSIGVSNIDGLHFMLYVNTPTLPVKHYDIEIKNIFIESEKYSNEKELQILVLETYDKIYNSLPNQIDLIYDSKSQEWVIDSTHLNMKRINELFDEIKQLLR